MSNIIESQVFSGELYIKASDHHRAVAAAVAAEREACAQRVETMGAQGFGTLAIAAAIRLNNKQHEQEKE